MIVAKNGSVLRLLRWQWKWVFVFLLTGTAAALVEYFYVISWLRIPAMPLAVVGAALGIFVSFRTNSAYDRWWEGRKLWGRLINSSRHFSTQVISYLPHEPGNPTEAQRELVHRQIVYVHVLRCLLRKQALHNDPELNRLLDVEMLNALANESNATHALLQQHNDQLTETNNRAEINDYRLASMDLTIAALLAIQGGCERIKNTPMPRGYAFIAERLIIAYGILFPFSIAHLMGWGTIPINVLVCLSFGLISEAGRVLEDPFTMYWNGLPLSHISATIEVNLRQRLGETELPPIPKPSRKGVLM